MKSIKENLAEVRSRVEKAAKVSGRNPDDVKIMAVSKTRSLEEVETAYEAGFRLFGENRVQEAVQKFSNFHTDAALHIIGHLQSNKAKAAAEIADCIESVDRIKIARVLDKYAEALHRKINVFIEFNTSGEESKSGFTTEDDFFRGMDEIVLLNNIQVTGLMTVGPLAGGETAVRKAFIMLRELFNKSKTQYPEVPLQELSMGMSSDFPIAVEEGATIVRIGTLLFGPRIYPGIR